MASVSAVATTAVAMIALSVGSMVADRERAHHTPVAKAPKFPKPTAKGGGVGIVRPRARRYGGRCAFATEEFLAQV